MTIHFHCGCGQKLKASPDSVGKHFDCPVCGTAVVVPEQDEKNAPVARKPAAAPAAAAVIAGDPPREAVGAAAPSRRQAADDAPHDVTRSRPAPAGRKNGKGGGNGHHKPAPKKPSDEDVALEALGLGDDGQSLAADTREIAESETKIIAGSDTKELDQPAEPSPRNGYLPESASRLRSDDEILADLERSRALNQRMHASELDPEASTADTARDLYRLVRKMKKSDQPAEPVKQKRKKDGAGEPFDYGGFFGEMARTVVPGAIGVVVVCLLAYWVSSSVMSGGRGLPELGDVSGVITLDGKPLEGATVTFFPQIEDEEAATHVSSSVGMTDAQGRYSLMYVKDVEGAAVGKHIVAITAPQPNGAESLPHRYNLSSELEFEVKPGSNDAPFELTSK